MAKSGIKQLVEPFIVRDGKGFDLKDCDPDSTGGIKPSKKLARELLQEGVDRLRELQEKLYAQDKWGVLLIFQALDAAGKDGAIEHVMSGVNPQGCQVFAFKKPSDAELDHTFLWRYMKAVPERGRLGIFNRSYYEDVLVVRVHPEILARQKLPAGSRGRRFWNDRYDDINAFERHLVRNGTLVLKFFLHISRAEQRRRFLARLSDPAKHWKFSDSDIDEREHWDAYQEVFERALRRTSTAWAPWWVIPADHKWVTRALVAAIITRSIQDLGLRMPVVGSEREQELEEARRRLEGKAAA